MKVKAYGKVLVFGAYAILEPGNLGLVVNVDKGTTADTEGSQPGKYVFDEKEFAISVNGEKRDIEDLKFLKCALNAVFEYMKLRGIPMQDVRLSSTNDPQLSLNGKKTGFGSSATAIVSAVAAILKLHDIDDRDLVYKLSRYAHFMAQGSGSGFDISSSCYGSHYFASDEFDSTDLDEYLKKGAVPRRGDFIWPGFLASILVFTGKSASTEKLVSKVLAFKKKNLEKYNEFMFNYNKVNLMVKNAIESSDALRIKNALEVSWLYRKKLGDMAGADIEPDNMTEFISNLKLHGALTAGLIGAGGGDSILVLCNPAKRPSLISYIESKRMAVLDVAIIDQGYEFLS
jgi:phosphomevalonate kinase